MNVFGIGLPELAVIAAIGLLVFGPRRLPELGRTLGKTLRGFQSASSEFEKEFRTAIASSESMIASEASPSPAELSDGVQPGSAPAESAEQAGSSDATQA